MRPYPTFTVASDVGALAQKAILHPFVCERVGHPAKAPGTSSGTGMRFDLNTSPGQAPRHPKNELNRSTGQIRPIWPTTPPACSDKMRVRRGMMGLAGAGARSTGWSGRVSGGCGCPVCGVLARAGEDG